MSRRNGHDAFSLREVSVRFGRVTALDRVSLRIATAERVALVGPSGAGKTTLLRLFNGTARADQGKVEVEGEPIGLLTPGALRTLRSRIGFIHQDLSLVPNLRVIQNVLTGRLGGQSLLSALRGLLLTPSPLALEVHRILERVGIADKLYERTDRLSGGEQQRVAIARALYQSPIALLADEPVASVDPVRARDTVGLLADISREQGLTLCMSLHNLELAREFFPRLIGLRGGRIVFDSPAEELGEDAFEQLYELGNAAGGEKAAT